MKTAFGQVVPAQKNNFFQICIGIFESERRLGDTELCSVEGVKSCFGSLIQLRVENQVLYPEFIVRPKVCSDHGHLSKMFRRE